MGTAGATVEVGALPGAGLADVLAARGRVTPFVRRTPVLEAGGFALKLENLQVTGSFKARGALNAVLGLSPRALARGVVAASGGNHGAGVAHAARAAGATATVFLPRNCDPAKVERMRRLGATVIVFGEVFDEAQAEAEAFARRRGAASIHPFADPAVVAGQGTLALELLEQLPEVETVVAAVGGGGLIGGLGLALKALRPDVRLVGVEPTGAPTLARSLEMGRAVELETVDTAAAPLAVRRTTPHNLELARLVVDEMVLVTDAEMREAARWLWRELGVAAELSGAAATAVALAGRTGPGRVCALVCGAGTDGL